MDYVGYHRIGWKWVLIFGFCLLLFGFGCYVTFDDAMYHDLATTGRRRLSDLLPRPVLQLLMTVCFGAVVVAIPVKLHAVLTGKLSFAIRSDGIHTYPFLWNRHRHLGWGNIHSAMRVNETLTFSGRDGSGRKVSVAFTPMGHRRKDVLAAIAHYRADVAEALE